MIYDLIKYSSEQIRAIRHKDGPALVVAGPGSGKTSVICERIRYLIGLGTDPARILVITFSKQAAINMQARFINETSNYYQVCFSTFHAFFFSILKDCYHYNNSNIINNSQKLDVLKKIMINLQLVDVQYEILDKLLKRISYYKNSGLMMDFEDDTNINHELFTKIYREYSNVLSSMNKIDFDDMQLHCLKLLKSREDICQKYRNKYQYILVDEYQDINPIQQAILDIIINEDRNLFCVGDDDQSIYGFRGAKPAIMQHFADNYTETKIYYLSTNFRCSAKIVESANLVIGQNHERLAKDIISCAKANPGKVYIHSFDSRDKQNEYIIDRLQHYCNRQGTIAVLYRTNRDYIDLLLALNAKNIQCNVVEKINNIYESVEFRDFIHYINMANSAVIDRSDFVAVINKPVRYISRNIITRQKVDLNELINNCDSQYKAINLVKFSKDLKMLSKMDMYCAFNYFRNVIGYDDYLKNENKFNMKLLDELKENLKGYSTYAELENYIKDYNDKIKECSYSKDSNINIMTFHSSKGLEFDEVIIPDLNEGTVPVSKAVTEQAIEEERRMFYVAITRAKMQLSLTYVHGNSNMSKSRFLYIFDKKY